MIPVVVYCLPEISLLSVPDSCEGTNSLLSYNTIAGTNPIDTLLWSFGGNIINSDYLTHVLYESCGDYNIIVEIQDTYQCSSYDSIPATVLCNTIPIITLTDSITCGDETIRVSANDTTLSYFWQPTLNSSQPTNQDWIVDYYIPTNFGPDSILHIVSVVEENNFCSSTTFDTIIIYPIPIVDFVIDTINCNPLLLNLLVIFCTYHQLIL